MLPTKETQHVEKSRALLIEQFKNRRVLTGFLDVLSRRVQDVENVLWDVIDKRLLASAADAQLDSLGRLVGEKRDGRNDTAYRKGIGLRIRVNRSQGRAFDLVDVLLLWGSPFTYTEFRFLSWQADVPFDAYAPYLALLLTEAKAASSYGCIVSSSCPPEAEFSFSNGSDTAAGHVFADVV